jgi:hypothetical protein
MQTPHVAANARNSQEAGTAIDQPFEHCRVELLFTHQIYQNTRIEIAAARAHDHPAGRGQSHAGIDRFAAFTAVTLAPFSPSAVGEDSVLAFVDPIVQSIVDARVDAFNLESKLLRIVIT